MASEQQEWGVIVLRPCPFCGGRAHLCVVSDDDTMNAGGRYIECLKCSASSVVMFPLKEGVDLLLAERWNARAALAPSRTDADSLTPQQRAFFDAASELYRLNRAYQSADEEARCILAQDCQAAQDEADAAYDAMHPRPRTLDETFPTPSPEPTRAEPVHCVECGGSGRTGCRACDGTGDANVTTRAEPVAGPFTLKPPVCADGGWDVLDADGKSICHDILDDDDARRICAALNGQPAPVLDAVKCALAIIEGQAERLRYLLRTTPPPQPGRGSEEYAALERGCINAQEIAAGFMCERDEARERVRELDGLLTEARPYVGTGYQGTTQHAAVMALRQRIDQALSARPEAGAKEAK